MCIANLSNSMNQAHGDKSKYCNGQLSNIGLMSNYYKVEPNKEEHLCIQLPDLRKEEKEHQPTCSLAKRDIRCYQPVRHFPFLGMLKHVYLSIKDQLNMKRSSFDFSCINNDLPKHKINPQKVAALKEKCEKRSEELFDMCRKGEALVINFANGLHSAILVKPEEGPPRYFSYGSPHLKKYNYNEKFALDDVIKRPGETDVEYQQRDKIFRDIIGHHDIVDDRDLVILQGLDCKKIIDRGKKLSENSWYNCFTNNCALFVANVIKSGIQGIKPCFHNRRILQMPENTLQLARETQEGISSGKIKSTAKLLEPSVLDCGSVKQLINVYDDSVLRVRRSFRFRITSFLCKLFGYDSRADYGVRQTEKFISKHILGSPVLKQELIDQLKQSKMDEQKVRKLLSLLRLDNHSIERVVKLNDVELLKFYLNHFGADSLSRMNSQLEVLMMYAIRNQSNRVVKYLVDEGVGTNKVDRDQNTPLILAAKKGNTEVVRLLLQKGYDKSVKNKFGQDALTVAKKYDHGDIIKMLENSGLESEE